MGKFLKILLYVVIGLAALLCVAITFTIGWRPIIGPKARPLTSRQFERTPQRQARGQYLATALCGCMECHSPRDWSKHGAPLTGPIGSGAPFMVQGTPGTVIAPNLTPDPETGSGNWSDDQLARAIREGIGHDGRTLFPIMPYQNFRHMSDEDLASIVVYLRSLPPARHPLPRTEIIFPVKYLVRSAPEPITSPVSAPDPTDHMAWGKYLVTLGGCNDCHTVTDKGKPLPGMELAGGAVFDGAWGEVAAANITPDPSGISYYDENLFIETMRTGFVKARELKAIMPYNSYGNLTDDDLKTMFAYLRTVKPVKHLVDNTEPPTYCRLCRQKHGGGDRN